MMKIRRAWLAIPLWLLGACALAQPAAQPLPVTDLSIGMYRIQAEVASSDAARERGLMYRTEMAPSAGMLFVFENSQAYCFWMRNTRIPLAIAFIDEAGKIINIEEMAPQSDENHCAARPARYALEMNRGWFSAKGIKAGAEVAGLRRPASR